MSPGIGKCFLGGKIPDVENQDLGERMFKDQAMQFLCVCGEWGGGRGWGHLFKRKTHWIGSPPCTNIGRECFLKHKCLCVKVHNAIRLCLTTQWEQTMQAGVCKLYLLPISMSDCWGSIANSQAELRKAPWTSMTSLRYI